MGSKPPQRLDEFNMDRKQFNYVKRVLQDLTVGRYPRVDHLPLLLNLHQNRFVLTDNDRLMVYFHPTVLPVPPAEARPTGASSAAPFDPGSGEQPSRPEVSILEHAQEDMQRQWRVLRETYRSTSESEPVPGVCGRYRFLFFIHTHRIEAPGFPYQKTVYTLSIWDREWDELIWHDVYPFEREDRRRAIHQFWTRAKTNFLPEHLRSGKMGSNTIDPRLPERIRYKTVYHTWENHPSLPPPPRDTIMFVLATAMFHTNEATYKDQVVMRKEWEFVTGHRSELIPHLVFCGLMICLESKYLPDNDIERQTQFLRLFGVSKKMTWMKEGLQSYITMSGWPVEFSTALRL
ncbi:hypothetical protein PG993_012375 [Apiospora rasikravindrae]|uniref:Uncharacterized protein n=1 Tax=Apiospora rasikravindrae TaxID=990691 RepID=A0ABR1S2A6_9PEZI